MSLTNLPKWIKASLAEHFNAQLNPYMKFFIEGERPEIKPGPSWAELRIDGPFIKPQASNYYMVVVEVDILLVTMANVANLYQMEQHQGITINAFTNFIAVNQYGDGGGAFDCLQLDDKIITNNFGIVDPVNKIMQASIEGHYFMNVKLT